jgi:hypothetical protein
MAITGGCLCGAIRYRIEAEPRATRACWCRTCQYLGAGNATVNVFFPSEAIVVEGEIKEYASPADSGAMVAHAFCPVCGTPVFTQSETRRQVKGVRAGTLDDTELGADRRRFYGHRRRRIGRRSTRPCRERSGNSGIF